MTVVFAAAGLVVGLIGALLALVAMNRARRMAALTARRIRSELAASGPLDPRAIRDVAVVRYDALEEMAGQLSFSVAMLNAHGDGVVLTSINGRTETRTYAKVVADGRGVHQLSPEEEHAVRSAQLGHGPPTLLTQAPRLVGGHGPVRPATAADAERARAAAQHASYWPADRDGRRGTATGATGPEDRSGTAAGASGPDGRRGAATGAAASDGGRTAEADGRRTADQDGKRGTEQSAQGTAAQGTRGTAAERTAAQRTAAQRAAEPARSTQNGDGQRTASGDGAKPGTSGAKTTAPAADRTPPSAGKAGPADTRPGAPGKQEVSREDNGSADGKSGSAKERTTRPSGGTSGSGGTAGGGSSRGPATGEPAGRRLRKGA